MLSKFTSLTYAGSVLCVDETYGYDATLGCALLELSTNSDYKGPALCGVSLCPHQLYQEGDHHRIGHYTQTHMRNFGVSLWKSGKMQTWNLPAPPWNDDTNPHEEARKSAPSLVLADYAVLKPLGTSGVLITPQHDLVGVLV